MEFVDPEYLMAEKATDAYSLPVFPAGISTISIY